MYNQSAADTVREILASEICDSWVFDWGQMIGQLHGQDLRAGYQSNKVWQTTNIYGVELSSRLQQIYSNGFDIGVNGWPVVEPKANQEVSQEELEQVKQAQSIQPTHLRTDLFK